MKWDMDININIHTLLHGSVQMLILMLIRFELNTFFSLF